MGQRTGREQSDTHADSRSLLYLQGYHRHAKEREVDTEYHNTGDVLAEYAMLWQQYERLSEKQKHVAPGDLRC